MFKITYVFILILVSVVIFPQSSHAQRWKRQRTEYSFGLGATNFLGDLGGRDQVGTDGLMDLEYEATRYAASVGFR